MTVQEVIEKVERMNLKDRKFILLVISKMGVKVHEHGDGSRVDLSALTPGQFAALTSIIEQLAPIEQINRID